MADLQLLAGEMLDAAARLAEHLSNRAVSVTKPRGQERNGSIRVDGEELVALAVIPSIDLRVVVRIERQQASRMMAAMFDGKSDAAIVVQTVTQIATKMCHELAASLGVSAEGTTARICDDPGVLPPPPFLSFEGRLKVAGRVAPRLSVDFDGVARSKLADRRSRCASPAHPVAFSEFDQTPTRAAAPGKVSFEFVHDVPMRVRAVLGRAGLMLRDVVALAPGGVFELDKAADDPVDLYVNNILIARGEVVVIDGRFGVKISELNPGG